MKILEGLSAFSGIAMGPVHFKRKLQFSYLKKSEEGIEEEKRRGKEVFNLFMFLVLPVIRLVRAFDVRNEGISGTR